MSGDKLYSSKEIKALLERATVLQQQEDNNTEAGLSLEELEQIAADTGIDPNFIRQAIFEQKVTGSTTSDKKIYLLGAPLSLHIGKEVPYKLSLKDWELVVQEVRKTFRKSGGTVQKLGNSMEWMSPESKFIQASLTATPSKNKTRFYISTHFGKVAFFTYYIPIVLTLITFGGLASELNLSGAASFWLGAVSLVTILSGVRFAFGKLVNAQKKKLDKMLSRFEELMSIDDELSISSTKEQEPTGEVSLPDENLTEKNDPSVNNQTKLKQ
jgi:hypothetical protein